MIGTVSAKSRIMRKLLASGEDLGTWVKTLTREIHSAPNDRELLTLLLKK